MEREKKTSVPARDIPVPNSVSEAAQAALWQAAQAPVTPYPEEGDVDAWQKYIASVDGVLESMISKMSSGLAESTDTEAVDLGGVAGFRLEPDVTPDLTEQRVVYDIHGGALIQGGGKICSLMAMGTAHKLNAVTYAVDYRMPPLHPYPAPLEDCLNGYRFLLERYRPEQIVVHGSSAGGNLAAAMLLRCREESVPFPAGVILVSPEVDLTESGDSFAVMAGVDVMLKRSLMPANRLYANGHDLTDPLLSPLFGDFSRGFPPTAITSGTRDLFLSNAVRLHNALRRAGNHSELYIEEAMPHGGFFGTPEDAALARDLQNFADRAWNGDLSQNP